MDYFAGRSHDAWRRQFHKNNPKEKALPRMRERGGVMVDVNQPWAKLHAKAKADNRQAAYDAYAAISKFPDDREKAADFVHKAWIRRNKGDASQPKHLFKPYSALPEFEKDKDRAHVDNMKKAVAAVRRTLKKKAPQKRAAKKAPAGAAKSVAIDPVKWRRLETLASQLSAMGGRTVTTEQLVRAGVEVILAIYGGASSGAKAKRKR